MAATVTASAHSWIYRILSPASNHLDIQQIEAAEMASAALFKLLPSTQPSAIWVALSSLAMIAMSAIVFIATLLIRAPYGRYSPTTTSSSGGGGGMSPWGPLVPAKLMWFFMESPNLWTSLGFLVYYRGGYAVQSLPNALLLGMFVLHYINRSIIFPLSLNKSSNPMPLSVGLLAFLYCSWNGFTQSLSLIATIEYPSDYITDPRMLVGSAVFFFGMHLNRQADNYLSSLKSEGSKSYKIPRGGLFEYVSCANYAAEILEWTGFAIASWSLPGLAFAIFTFCNIGTRAQKHHQWYREKFDDYPKNRKAVIPFIW